MLSVEDHFEILNLYSKINAAYDAGNAEAFANCFTEDGRYERPLVGGGLCTSGRAELMELVEKQLTKKVEPKKHLSLNISIDADGDGAAQGHSYHFVVTDGEVNSPPRFHATGTCDDRFVLTSEGWRLRYRRKFHAFTD